MLSYAAQTQSYSLMCRGAIGEDCHWVKCARGAKCDKKIWYVIDVHATCITGDNWNGELFQEAEMTRDAILEKLRDAMQSATEEEVNWNTVTEDTAIGELGFDSLSILDLIYDVQQAFGIEFDAEELVNVNTVGELADFLEEELQA